MLKKEEETEREREREKKKTRTKSYKLYKKKNTGTKLITNTKKHKLKI